MTKKIVFLLMILTFIHASLYADWRLDIPPFFGKAGDFRGAIDYLLNNFETFDETDRAVVSGLLAYSYHRINEKNNEYKWLGEYFETYGGYGFGFDFLDESTNEAVADYIIMWLGKYPLITNIGFIDSGISYASSPPAQLVMGIEMRNNAYYKLSDEKKTIKGGLFLNGYNSISIETWNLLEQVGSHLYFLDLKVDDLILRKEIKIETQMNIKSVVEKPEIKVTNREYTVSMFVGDQLVASAKKLYSFSEALKMDLPPGRGRYEPFGPVEPTEKPDPFSSSFSILSAVAGIYQLIKELTKDKNKEPPTPPIQLQHYITVTFMRKNPAGVEEEVRALLTLKKINLNFYFLR